AAPASLLSSNPEQQPGALLPSSDAGAAMAEPQLHARPERHHPGGGSPAGYSPAQIRHAYGFDQLTRDGTGITIGIIDAYDDPTIQSDLNTFSTQFGLPTTGSGTFTFTQACAQGTSPSASPYVSSVGGTTLSLESSGNRTSAETAWSSGGGGASGNEAEPGYQVSYGIVSNGRPGTPDVSYDANPTTGFAVYDSTSYFGQSGWLVFGGTSAGALQWAALVALADQG